MALVVPPPELTPAAVAAATDRLLDDPSIAAATRALQVEIEAMPAADDVLAGTLARPPAVVPSPAGG